MTIKQKTVTIEFDTSKVVVRRMTWKATRGFLRKLGAHLAALGASLTDVLPKLPEIITSTEDLAEYLVINSTDLSAEEFDKLDLQQAAGVLATAVDLNAGPDLKNYFAGIGATLGALMPAGMTMRTGAASMHSLSTPATPPNT
jgi:hypothetical protein